MIFFNAINSVSIAICSALSYLFDSWTNLPRFTFVVIVIHIQILMYDFTWLASMRTSFKPLLAFRVVISRTRAITGVEHLRPSRDDLKAFSAAFATSSSAPMFHLVGLTQEAPTLEAACPKSVNMKRTYLTWKQLYSCWHEFNHGPTSRKVDLVSLGNPHFSFQEIKKLAHLCKDRTRCQDVEIIVTCGRAQYGLAAQAGHVEAAEKFGVKFLQDTCWCHIEEPVIAKPVQVIMTNSGKYVHYGPGLTGRKFCFGSLEKCVETACTGRSSEGPPAWLQHWNLNGES